MSKWGWTFWMIALGAWGLYSCWYFGYQSGYADGHATAWKMYEPPMTMYQIAAKPESDEPPDPVRARSQE